MATKTPPEIRPAKSLAWASKVTGLSWHLLKEKIRRGELPGYLMHVDAMGRESWRVYEQDVYAFVEDRLYQPAARPPGRPTKAGTTPAQEQAAHAREFTEGDAHGH